MAALKRDTVPSRARQSRNYVTPKSVILGLLSASPMVVSAQSSNCISLKDSKACPAFTSASISTGDSLLEFFPFLRYVSDRASFDSQLSNYVQRDYVQRQYQSLFGCSNLDLTNTSDLYARFTTTVLCNSIVQNSIEPCGLSASQSRPLCADSCAEYAQSEAYITSDDELCSNPSSNLLQLIRADFTNCALPGGSLDSKTCIPAIENESQNCGYGNSTVGLCTYCGSGGLNSTDTCCYNSNAEERCKDVKLPTLTATMTFTRVSPTSSATGSSTAGSGNDNSDEDDDEGGGGGGLSGGAIAGIVVGVLAGLGLLALGLLLCLRRRRRPSSPKGSIFNQPSPARQGGTTMAQAAPSAAPQGYEVLPGGRIARMSALEGHSGDSPSHHRDTSSAAGGIGAVGTYPRRDHSSSDEFTSSPPSSETRGGVLRPPPTKPRRHGSLSSSSALGSSVPQSPSSAGGFSSPQGVASQQSEQLPFFKDYYSQDDIHPGDRIAVLWAYQPRATDEFALERGDMLKVVGIWDDGWATGVMLNERADEWEARRQAQRDSGVSNASGRRDSSPAAEGEIKAFPLVCVCRPEHWRKTIEGDGSTETGSNGFNAHSSFS
ncbi:hypothetical protein LB506_006773 [Fusarium annulatum]|uniref:SH3 domain-containing protein n=2 Tax=Gibberella intermedia TaxID=948311 RepID=A0A365N7Z5_GIBIN|nr:uncharacterized protein FPRO_02820 [Fusarium proliferatum ET1]KAG4252415.1 hypothetical protein FPRO03_07864 [Fusarium proliferatum]KAI1054765.1 hypothetical protein LB506_006773 [Fusarium annulatum]KAG4272141.1 hypothetical protein FPRO04_02198 [Fusarium proliferatum]RBA16933.1 hypothetical protein FPRO05_01657 [Fusarium proliferatum]RKL49523.1 hypothetical protein BFJ72_g982 [Fusarium proliferatum]